MKWNSHTAQRPATLLPNRGANKRLTHQAEWPTTQPGRPQEAYPPSRGLVAGREPFTERATCEKKNSVTLGGRPPPPGRLCTNTPTIATR